MMDTEIPISANQEAGRFSLTRFWEVLRVALKLGIIGFGGPAAHIALMHKEIVRERRWVDEQKFMDLVGATNLIPGPNSTEMMIHLGYLRAGWPGLLVGGAGFILPAMFMVMGIAWVYVRYGELPATAGILYGIKPLIVSIILDALWKLRGRAFARKESVITGAAAFILYLLGVNELILVFGGGLLVLALDTTLNKKPLLPIFILPVWLPGVTAVTMQPFSLSVLFLTFLKIGSVLYGSGYVLLAFLRTDFVLRLGWLTDQQLLDAIAVGQVTPGPVFTTATFIGYLLGGVPGGVLATLGIFLPSFVFVAGLSQLMPKVRSNPTLNSLLDGVVASSLALMAGVTLQIGRSAILDLWTITLAVISFLLLIRFKISSTWLILLGGLVGIIRYLL